MNITDVMNGLSNGLGDNYNLIVKFTNIFSHSDILSFVNDTYDLLFYWIYAIFQIYGVLVIIVMLWAINRSIDNYNESGNTATSMKAFIDVWINYLAIHFKVLVFAFNLVMIPIQIVIGTVRTLI